MKSRILRWVPLAIFLCTAACGGDPPELAKLRRMGLSRITTDRTYFRDEYGRYVQFQGVNVGGSSKTPYYTEEADYIGRPFPLQADLKNGVKIEDADWHFSKIKALGFNSVRLLFMWEAVEPVKVVAGETDYNRAFLDYFDQIIGKAEAHGLYVLINMHENLFSRHLYVRYNENVDVFYQAFFDPPGQPGNSLFDSVLATFPVLPYEETVREPYDWCPDSMDLEDLQTDDLNLMFSDRVTGDGAPLWAVQACLPEKKDYIGGRKWGTFRPIGFLDAGEIGALVGLLESLGGGSASSGGIRTDNMVDWRTCGSKAEIWPTKPYEGTDLMPLTFWGINGALSLDIERCYAAFFAGDKVYPKLKYNLNGQEVSVKEYLQDSFTNVWREIAKVAKKHENVIGYDMMNEPMGGFIALTAAAAYFQTGLADTVRSLVIQMLGPETGEQVNTLLFGLGILPWMPSRTEAGITDESKDQCRTQYETEDYDQCVTAIKREWGFEDANLATILELNFALDKNYLQPLFERVGAAIQEEDPNAILWIEGAFGLNMVLGGLGGGNAMWEMNMTRPAGLRQVVYSPHWYPDIYPNLGFNVPPREFTPGEWEFRDFRQQLENGAAKAAYSLGNMPMVFGEFGTYFNYNGIAQAMAGDYAVSEQILDNYYESFEDLGYSRLLWCYTADNSAKYGDQWNKEDFSILGPPDKNDVRRPRAERAYNRPYARALSGKLVASRFYSDLHYYDPEKGVPDPRREFYLEFASKETDNPTEIWVPKIQYPSGFYVWLTDGYAIFDDARSTLYYFPTGDAPGQNHKVVIRPPQNDRENVNWKYFFKDAQVLEGPGGEP